MEYIIEMIDIYKEFPGVVANDHITLRLKKGEIHALLGENGAGKSTLMSILFGLYHPDGGTIKVRGKKENISSPNVANDLGIGMVHQHFQLVHNFTVTENIILGMEGSQILDRKTASKKIKEISVKYNLNINPDDKIEDISVGMQQRAEILKMLYRDAEVLIFDEPTAVLTPQEIIELMHIIKNLIEEGKSVIIITHKLKEIKMIADRCSVIRRGKYIGTVDVKNTTTGQMAEMMVGREVSFTVNKGLANPGEEILKIDNLSVMSSRKVLGLKNFSLGVKRGEVMGVAGVEGNGQTELVEAITGLKKSESGSIFLGGVDITSLPIRKRYEAGISYIPEDRHKHGLILEYTVGENMILKSYYKEPYSKNGLLNDNEISHHADRIIEMFDVRTGEGGLSYASNLSGGNQQKAVVGREIDMNPDLLIAFQPTRGLDVGAIEYIHKRIIEQRDNGKAVLLVSLELDEIIDLSDRVAVLAGGELIDVVDIKDTNENELGLMMTGVRREDAHE